MRGNRSFRALSRAVAAAVLVLAAAGLFLSLPAMAADEIGLKVCNQSDFAVGVAVGQRVEQGWQSEGWTEIAAGGCAILIDGPLTDRYYYLYATDETGGAWEGDAYLCSRGRNFSIFGTEDCLARGYSRTPFFEVETLGAKRWTVLLREWRALFAFTPPLTSDWIQSTPEESSQHQLFELVTSSSDATTLPLLLDQSGAVWADRRKVLLAIQDFVPLSDPIATEVHVWLRESYPNAEVHRVSFYNEGAHIVTVVRDHGGFILGIDPGR